MKIKLAQVYTTDKQIEGNIRINLGEGELKDVKFKFEISNKENNYLTEIKADGNNYVKFGINPVNLTAGEYLLKVSAIKGQKEIGSCEEKIHIIKSHFQF
ncbi:MAG TPA: hypothetical protein PLW95_07500 [bacterium]|nr:hypothetical protein [bacterium]